MNTNKSSISRKIVLLSILPILIIGMAAVVPTVPVTPTPQSSGVSAKLSEIAGTVEAENTAQGQYNLVNDGFLLQSSMQLQTKEESRVRLDLSVGSIIRLGPLTLFSLDQQQIATQEVTNVQGILSNLELQAGIVWIDLTGGNTTLDVKTPAGLASVRGSYMSVDVDPTTNTITVTCLEGHCGYANSAGDVDMISGQKVVSSDLNILPIIQPMGQADIQSWESNSPESAAVLPQVLSIMAAATPLPSSTPTSSALIPSTGLGFPVSSSITGTPANPTATLANPAYNPAFFFTPTPAPVKSNPGTHTHHVPTKSPTRVPTVVKHGDDPDHDKDDHHDKDSHQSAAMSFIQFLSQLFSQGLPIRL